MIAKYFDSSNAAEFSNVITDLIGGEASYHRPFKKMPDICIAVRKDHRSAGLPANRELKRGDGSSACIIFGTFVVFAKNEASEICRDFSSVEKKILSTMFMDASPPNLTAMLMAAPSPMTDAQRCIDQEKILYRYSRASCKPPAASNYSKKLLPRIFPLPNTA